jgi:hypothetical protein
MPAPDVGHIDGMRLYDNRYRKVQVSQGKPTILRMVTKNSLLFAPGIWQQSVKA